MKLKLSKWFLLAAVPVLLLLLYSAPSPVQGQAQINFTDLEASHIFGESITFSGLINPDLDTTSVELTFRPQATGNSFVVSASRQGSNLSTKYTLQPQDYIPPFGTIEYWFSATLESGTQIESETHTYTYTDNRFTWETMTYDNKYEVSWIQGDRAFGQEIIDAVLETNYSFATYMDLPVPETLKIYVYPSSSALQSAMEITNASWVAGHAAPADNTILVSIPQGFDQQLTIQRQIPHEVTHVRLYLYMGENYRNLPAWLSEGLASISEQYTLPEYWQILQAAYDEDTLIPIETLCTNFPSENKMASLAYAEADSFTRYIYQTYGKFGLQNLVDAYDLGHSCETGVNQALDISLADLETAWQRETFNNAILSGAQASAIAWGSIFGIMIVIYLTVTILPKRRR
jgi:hypothetical protein